MHPVQPTEPVPDPAVMGSATVMVEYRTTVPASPTAQTSWGPTTAASLRGTPVEAGATSCRQPPVLVGWAALVPRRSQTVPNEPVWPAIAEVTSVPLNPTDM